MDLSHSEAGLLSGKSKRTHDRSRKKGHSSSRRNAAEGDERYPPKDEPDVEHLRQARANYFSKSPAERQARAKVPNISGPYEKMNHPKSSHRGTKDPETGHHKHRSKRSHTAREERAFKKNDEGEYVYRNNERKEENDQKSAKTTTQEGQESNKNELRRRKTVKPRTTSKGNPTSTNTDGKESKHGKSKAEDGHKARRSRADGANPGKPTITRSKTMYESPSKRHPSLERAKATRHASANPTIPPQVQSSSTKVEPGKKNDRNTGFLSMLFKAPPPAPPEKKVQCITCLSDDLPSSKTAKLSCDHRMCHSCLKRVFKLSLTDPSQMPPRCCRPQEHIPLKYVDKLFDDSFKMKWNKKYHEYTTKNRLYCPKRGCGEWIRPANIHADTSSGATGGRKYGICTRCKTKVCALCNNKWHPSRTCPKDEETRKFIETAKQEGWKRCFNCSAMVELKEGCNHMTCRCTAEFCMICGAKWKTCDCPWFNYDTVEQDRLLHMNVPHARQVHANDPAAANAPHAYHEELDRRRDQEARDEALARRLQGFGDDEDDTLAPENVNGNIIGIGNAAGHFLNQDFIRRATGFLTGNFGQGIDRVAQETRDNDANLLRPPAALLQAERAERAAARAQMRPPQAHLPVRARTNASRRHNNAPIATAEELAVPGHTTHNYATEATRHHPAAERRGTRRVSTLAGLTNGARGQGRVSGWLNGVAIGSNPHE